MVHLLHRLYGVDAPGSPSGSRWTISIAISYFFQVKIMEAILSNSTRKLLWFEITKMVIPVKNTFILLFVVIFDTLSFSTQWWRQLPGKQSHTWQNCCLLSYAFNCATVSWRFLQSVQTFQFFIRQGVLLFTCTQHFHSDTFFHNYIILLQKSSTRCGAHYTLSVQCHYNTTQVTRNVQLNISWSVS